MHEKTKTCREFPENLARAVEKRFSPIVDRDKILILLPVVKYRQKDGEALLRMYFQENLTMAEIGERQGLSVERIRQKIERSIFDLRRAYLAHI